MARIFIVEDNENIAEAVASYLRLEDHVPVLFPRLDGVMAALRMDLPDLLVLDVMLPDGDGFVFARQLRREFDVPIVFLTARIAESDRITGFELGADDYVVKPFSNRELVLRIQAVLRRRASNNAAAAAAESGLWLLEAAEGRPAHELKMDEVAHGLFHDGRPLDLTAAEWKILSRLVQSPGVVLSREKLLASALDYIADGSERTIDTHVKNIRSKFGEPGWIETVRGFGYRFEGHAG
ncbi:MAG: response regulator transcription factor [Spirochaetes bacterium]|nr:response regulator transcription factor [Spirochaetota bacterium]